MRFRLHTPFRPGAFWTRRVPFVLFLIAGFLLAVHSPNRVEEKPIRIHLQQAAQTPLASLQAALDSMHARYGFPGATAAYVWTDGSLGAAATGWADVEARRPMTPDSRMLAASIGKSFVAATAVALVEEGTLDLDAPIGRWLSNRPWFAELPNSDVITLRHLLTHRSGLSDHVHTDAFAKAVARRWREPGNPFPPDSLVQFVVGHPALFEPGGGWAYSDTGYILVGLIIEQATGRSYYELVQERFLTPLGLEHTRPSNSRTLPGLVAGYSSDNPFGWPTKTTEAEGTLAWHPGMEWTGGGLVSTSRDLARWGAGLFGGKALPATALDQMLSAAPIDSTQADVRYGMGVAVYRTSPLGPVYGHGGWIPGYVSSLRYYADHGVAIAFQINTDDGEANDMGEVVNDMEARLAEVVLSAKKTK